MHGCVSSKTDERHALFRSEKFLSDALNVFLIEDGIGLANVMFFFLLIHVGSVESITPHREKLK